jgi:hypothetical protein
MTFQKAEPREIKKLLQQHFNYPFSVRRDRGTAYHKVDIICGPNYRYVPFKSQAVLDFVGKTG